MSNNFDDQRLIKGSARSIAGFHIRDALDAVATRNPGILSKFGGHAMAAGLTLERQHLDKFRKEFEREAARQLDVQELGKIIWTDGELATSDIDLEFAEILQAARP